MRTQILYVPKYFSEKMLSDLEPLINKIEPTAAKVAGAPGVKTDDYDPSSFRSGEVRWITSNMRQIYRPFKTEILSLVNDSMDLFTVDIYQTLSALQHTTYRVGDLFKSHRDSYGGKHIDRKLSVIIKLNDSSEYQGGDFNFAWPPAGNKPLLHERGSVLIFPSHMMHSVEPVTSGVRRTLVAWVMGPPWR